MADRIVTAKKADRTPNWDKWRLIPEPALWQCVALSLNIDPDKVNIGGVGFGLVFHESQEFQDRLDVACGNAGEDRALDVTRSVLHREYDKLSLRQFAAWVRDKWPDKWPAPAELLAMADKQAAGNGKRTDPATANVFKTMDGLKWSEVIMTFTESEAVRIKARGKSETFTYEAMGFKNKQSRTAKPNLCWHTLRVLAIFHNTDKTLADLLSPRTDLKRRVSRLRDALQEFFGIKDDPIPYATTWKPAFALIIEEHVKKRAHDQVASDDEDEEDIEALMSQPPGR